MGGDVGDVGGVGRSVASGGSGGGGCVEAAGRTGGFSAVVGVSHSWSWLVALDVVHGIWCR